MSLLRKKNLSIYKLISIVYDITLKAKVDGFTNDLHNLKAHKALRKDKNHKMQKMDGFKNKYFDK